MTAHLNDSVLDAIEALLDAYRKKYLTPSTQRIRSNAPLQKEMGLLAAEYHISRQIDALRASGKMPTTNEWNTL